MRVGASVGNITEGTHGKHSLSMQRMAIEHLIAGNGRTTFSIEVTDAAKQGALTLAWLERRQELMKALDRLERERPDLVDLFREFPGAEIADVRSLFPAFSNGSGVE